MPTVSLPSTGRGLSGRRRGRDAAVAMEDALVRRSVGALDGEQPACRHCHRTPLVGEHVHLYKIGHHREEIVCELCLPRRTARPDRTLIVRPPAQGSVRAMRAPR